MPGIIVGTKILKHKKIDPQNLRDVVKIMHTTIQIKLLCSFWIWLGPIMAHVKGGKRPFQNVPFSNLLDFQATSFTNTPGIGVESAKIKLLFAHLFTQTMTSTNVKCIALHSIAQHDCTKSYGGDTV